jgi:hypothetical protein
MRSPFITIMAGLGVWASVLVLAPQASAEQIDLQFVTTTGATSVTYTYNGNSASATPGPYYWNASPPPNMGSNPIATFCIEVTQYTLNGTYDVVAPAAAPTIGDPAKADAIRALYGNYYNLAWNNPATAWSDPSFRPFQLALWELVYDGLYNLANPGSDWLGTATFRSGSSAAGAATSMLNNTLANIPAGLSQFNTRLAGYELVALVSQSGQDQLWLRPSSVIPAPPAILLAGLGLLVVGGRASWRKCQA